MLPQVPHVWGPPLLESPEALHRASCVAGWLSLSRGFAPRPSSFLTLKLNVFERLTPERRGLS